MARLTYVIIQGNTIWIFWGVTISSGSKQQFWVVIWVWPDSEPASLSVERKLVKPHGTDEGDVGGLAVQHVLVRVYPQTRQLWKNIYHFVCFEIVDENVGHPKIFDEFKIHGHHHRIRGVWIWPAQLFGENLVRIMSVVTPTSMTLQILASHWVFSPSTRRWSMLRMWCCKSRRWSSAPRRCRCLCRCCSPGRCKEARTWNSHSGGKWIWSFRRCT